MLVLIVLLVCVFFPPLATGPFAQEESTVVIRDVFMQTSTAYLWFSPAIHVITLLLLVAVYRYGARVGRVANAFFGMRFLFFAFGNHIAVTSPKAL